jgi:hypothetical protein
MDNYTLGLGNELDAAKLMFSEPWNKGQKKNIVNKLLLSQPGPFVVRQIVIGYKVKIKKNIVMFK